MLKKEIQHLYFQHYYSKDLIEEFLNWEAKLMQKKVLMILNGEFSYS